MLLVAIVVIDIPLEPCAPWENVNVLYSVVSTGSMRSAYMSSGETSLCELLYSGVDKNKHSCLIFRASLWPCHERSFVYIQLF